MEQSVESDAGITVERDSNPDEWNSFLEEHGGPVYATWGWSDAVASYGHDRYHLVARDDESGTLLGTLPLCHVDSRLFGSRLLSPAFAERGSVTLAGDAPDATRQLLLGRTKRLANDLGVDSVSLRGSRVAGTDEFHQDRRYVTFQVDVDRDPDAVWAGVKDSRQRQIDQARRDESLEFGVGDSLSALEEYYDLYLESMRGHGSPPHSFAFFRTLWDHLHDTDNLRLSTVHYDGKLINGMIDLSLGSTVYQWGVVSDYDHREQNGGSLLLWNSLEWASENGYDTYEFGRTREGSGVYMFKKSFGGSKVWYDDLHYFPDDGTDLPDPEDEKYDRAKAVWRRLPLSVTRVVGPRIRKRIGL